MNLSKSTIISIIIGVVLLVGAGYMLFLRPTSNVAVVESAPTSPAEATFVNLAAQLEPLGFDTSILSDPRFMSLVDIHTAVIPEAAGRRDPFAQFGR